MVAQDHPSRLSIGKNWVDKFLKRHTDLRIVWSEAVEASRPSAAKPDLIVAFIRKLGALRTKYDVDPHDIWNFDEKGVQAGGVNRRLLIVQRLHAAHDKQRRAPGDRTNLTLVECVSALGEVAPPLIILHASEAQVDWAQDNIVPQSKLLLEYLYILISMADYRITNSETGWSNTNIALRWLIDVLSPLRVQGGPAFFLWMATALISLLASSASPSITISSSHASRRIPATPYSHWTSDASVLRAITSQKKCSAPLLLPPRR